MIDRGRGACCPPLVKKHSFSATPLRAKGFHIEYARAIPLRHAFFPDFLDFHSPPTLTQIGALTAHSAPCRSSRPKRGEGCGYFAGKSPLPSVPASAIAHPSLVEKRQAPAITARFRLVSLPTTPLTADQFGSMTLTRMRMGAGKGRAKTKRLARLFLLRNATGIAWELNIDYSIPMSRRATRG